MSPIPGHHLSEPAWRRVKGGAWIALTVVFVVLLVRAENKSDEAIDRVTKVESPCLKYGAKSEQCKKAFEQAVLTITHAQACAILRKAGLEIEPCANARLAQESTRRRERATTDQQRPGGDAPTGPTGTLQPSPHEGGGGNGAGSGGGDGPGKNGGGGPSAPSGGGNAMAPAPDPAPVPAPSPSPAPSPGRSSDAPGDPEPKGDPPGALPSTLEAAGGVVKEAGDAAQGAVEGAGKAADCVVRGNC